MHSRRLLPLVAVFAALGLTLFTAGCAQVSAPTYDTNALGCEAATDALLATATSKLDVPGVLRNGKIVEGEQGRRFLSAELHRPGDDKHAKGDLLTFAVADDESGVLAVDVNARDDTTWPHASYDVRSRGARESRACANLVRGKTKAQIECEQQSGGAVPIPGKRDCGSL